MSASERWERVSSIFAAARTLEARARSSFLALACEGDDSLRTEIEALLAADTPDDGFLEQPPWQSFAQSVAIGFESPQGLTGGQVLSGRYRIERELGAGGQALVYLAHDQHLMMRPVVIKLMRGQGYRSRWLKSGLEREMQALARIDHPGVVGILDVGELEDGSPFLVIQHVAGASLRQLLSRGPIPPERAGGLIRQMGSALGAAHAVGVAHCDLKPENVMLQQRNDGSDVVRLIDFGIARIVRSGLEPETATVLVGTVRYMAPEQFQGVYSPASDIHALASVACEMLCGHPDIRALPPKTSRATRAALEMALAFRAEERPSDVHQWSESLARTLLAGRRRVRRLVFGVALAAIAVVTPLLVEWSGGGGSAEPVRIVEKVGAFDPVIEGFETRGEITSSGVTENPTHSGYDGWRVATTSHGLYHRALSGEQARRAMERGWTLTVEMRAEEGMSFAAAEFTPAGPGFPIQVQLDGEQEIVRLPTQVVPDLRGLEITQRPPGQYRRYRLTYDPVLRTADLWIDGERRLTGYGGWSQNTYRLDAGLLFGTANFESERAAGSFRLVRFEITP